MLGMLANGNRSGFVFGSKFPIERLPRSNVGLKPAAEASVENGRLDASEVGNDEEVEFNAEAWDVGGLASIGGLPGPFFRSNEGKRF